MFKLLTNLLARMIGIKDDPADVREYRMFTFGGYEILIVEHLSPTSLPTYQAVAINTDHHEGPVIEARELETGQWDTREQALVAIKLDINEANRGRIEY